MKLIDEPAVGEQALCAAALDGKAHALVKIGGPVIVRHDGQLQAVQAMSCRRVAFVGGGGSLEIEPGLRAVDAPGFPEQHKAEALAQAEALEVLRGSDGNVDWTYMSPPPHHLVPGEKTSGYQVRGGDRPVANAAGESRITAGDFAAAFVDELEANRFSRQRLTAGS